MQETIQVRLESSRKELLDLGLRNPLLNYKTPKGRGLQIIKEKSEFIYDILVKQLKTMTFLGIPERKQTTLHDEVGFLNQPVSEESYRDTRLQTNEEESKLQTRLLNTYYFARTSIEEQGVNILYLALGMLKWYEAGNTEDLRSAPLLLIPVTLERSSAQERFRLKYSGADIGPNLSLQAKMRADFNIAIPDLAEADDFNLVNYFKEISQYIAREKDWSVEADAIELGFFSFGKFLIYNDLDTDKWPEAHKPQNHVNLQALFNDGFKDEHAIVHDDQDLDEETIANELFRVVDADSSQVLAMLAVNEGRNMVIQGPPGTGKSQTITNIIANAVGQGKKVLFVAEKMAALEVVKRRLDSINLGEACLELHSHKANKRELHDELKRVLELGKPALKQLEQEVQLLASYRNELNDYCNAINTAVAGSGLSPQQVIGFLLKIDRLTDRSKLIKLPIERIDHWNAEAMRMAEEMADRIQARLKDIGVPAKLAFWGSRLTRLLPHEKNAILLRLQGARQSVFALQEISAAVAGQMRIEPPATETDTTALLEQLLVAAKSPDLKDLDVMSDIWLLKEKDIAELLDNGEELDSVYRRYKDILVTEAWQQDILEIRRNLVTYGDKWYNFIIGSYRKSNQQLASFLKVALPGDTNEKLRIIDVISEARRLENTLRELEPFASSIFGKRWLKQRSDWASLRKAAAYLASVHKQVADSIHPKTLLSYLATNPDPELAAVNYKQLERQFNDAVHKRIDAVTALELDELLRFQRNTLQRQTFSAQAEVWAFWIEHFPEIQIAIDWNNLEAAAKTAGCGFLINASAEWEGAAEALKTALQKTWYEYLIEQAFRLNPALTRFERASHEEVVEKFKKLDQVNLHYNRARVALKHWEGVPKQQAGGQVNILRTEFNRKARFMPIRKLVEEAGLAMQAIKPVWMMSPMSIANFLPPGVIEFDMVIFDEASQVRPVEALGAIIRGKQLVVVGDTKQLPPTSFFDKMNTDIEDEENVTSDLQSILGMCDGQGAPSTMLKWHYRSRHESLISLSNHEFYEDKLVIFPSPGSRQSMGLRFHHLPDAVYDRGKTRTNPIEAERVAQAVFEHANKTPNLSLGVVAFSTSQMEAIQNALEIQRRKHPESEVFFSSHAHEPFFIKNLENVQGDERDVILISIGYGRTEDGKIPMSFGPLNNEGGERRLNVLITRAKMRCEVFTNITAEDIKVGENAKFGIRALKSFLYFAQFARFDHAVENPVTEMKPFEEEVALQLTKLGYSVRTKIGSSGFYLDLGIIDPENPGRYILGIECDGQTYASARSATDRDRLREQVLELFGWQIYRVWSTDWYRNPERELKRLAAAIEHAKTIAANTDAETVEYIEEQNLVKREEPQATQVPAYKLAKLPAAIGKQELHLYSFGELGQWITDVVVIEGPVHFDEMSKRLVEAAGISKVGSRIKYTLTQATRYAEQTGKIKIKSDFLWDALMEVPVVRDRSNLPPASRKLQNISPEEITLAICQVVDNSIAITEDAVVPIVARLFGFARVTEEIKQVLLEAIRIALEGGEVQKDGLYLKIK